MAYITYTLDLGVIGEVDCSIKYNYTPGQRATMYDKHGDPGDPGSSAEVSILHVIADGYDITNLVAGILECDDDFLVAVEEQERGE